MHVMQLPSFSIETAFFEEFFENASSLNELFLNLLEDHACVPTEIRIGGLDVTLINSVNQAGAQPQLVHVLEVCGSF
jgi:hypothetical protein